MKRTNDRYLILLGTKNFTERYYRDKTGWLKISARGRKFRMTAEQVLNHLLPAVAGITPNLTLQVKHRDLRPKGARVKSQGRPTGAPGSDHRKKPQAGCHAQRQARSQRPS